MRKPFNPALLLVFLCVALMSIGCSQTRSTPTALATETESVVFVVVTATEQPTLAATELLEPTITPLATFTPIGLDSPTPTRPPTATVKPKATPAAGNTPKPVQTSRPGPAAATATTAPPAPSQNQYQMAPTAVSPAGVIVHDNNDFEFNYTGIGMLAGNQCYLVRIDLFDPNSGTHLAGDDFMDPNHCGDQSPVGRTLKFTVHRAGYNGPNYGAIAQSAESQDPTAGFLQVRWSVRVVQNNGPRGDGVHYNTVTISPSSGVQSFTFQAH